MEPNEQEQLPPNKQSTRTFEEWKISLIKLIVHNGNKTVTSEDLDDKRIKPYYDQCLMPEVCFKELFNR